MAISNNDERNVQGIALSGKNHLAFGMLRDPRNDITSMTLNWETSYAIALELKRQHPDVNIEDITLQQIYDLTLKLNEFEDDPALCNDDILSTIYQEWVEETIHDR